VAGETELLGKACLNAALSTTNFTWPDLGSNPGRPGRKPATTARRSELNNSIMTGGIVMKTDTSITFDFKARQCLANNHTYRCIIRERRLPL
jgi:hypothetical protein